MGIVKHDIALLYRMHMRHAIAAAPDQNNMRALVPIPYFNESFCFNTGVLLYDLSWWRWGAFIHALQRKFKVLSAKGDISLDQLAMNLVFNGHFDLLDFRWNLLGLGWYPWP